MQFLHHLSFFGGNRAIIIPFEFPSAKEKSPTDHAVSMPYRQSKGMASIILQTPTPLPKPYHPCHRIVLDRFEARRSYMGMYFRNERELALQGHLVRSRYGSEVLWSVYY